MLCVIFVYASATMSVHAIIHVSFVVRGRQPDPLNGWVHCFVVIIWYIPIYSYIFLFIYINVMLTGARASVVWLRYIQQEGKRTGDTPISPTMHFSGCLYIGIGYVPLILSSHVMACVYTKCTNFPFFPPALFSMHYSQCLCICMAASVDCT